MNPYHPNTAATGPATSRDETSPALRWSRRRPSRWAREVVLAGALAATTLAVTGCDFATDTPLGVTSTTRAVTPGHAITGKVIYPDGRITVTIAPFASPHPPPKMHRTDGERACEYHRFSNKYSCPTNGLDHGLYVVQVTDADQPGEGTARAQVAVTDFAGYNPRITAADGSGEATAGPVTLKLAGWKPGVAVRMRMIDENDKTVFTGSAVPDEHGAATVATPSLKVGHYNLDATDGLWRISGDEGSYNDAYSGLEVS